MSININVNICKRKERSSNIIIDTLFILLCIIMSVSSIQNNNYIFASVWIFLFAVLLYTVVDK
jgi:hypothetical protein